MVKSLILIIFKYFSKNEFLRLTFTISATAKGSMKIYDFVSIYEKQVKEIFCLFGTSDWFAAVNVFDVSC